MANLQVTNLLTTYLKQNCQQAGADDNFVEQIIELALDRNPQAFPLFKVLIKTGKNRSQEKSNLGLVDLSNAKTFVDIGANKLAAINYYGKKFPNLEQLIGIDIVPQQRPFHFPQKSRYIPIDADATHLPLADNFADAIQFRFVLHHLPSKEQIVKMLEEAHRVLAEDGKLFIWEESFTKNYSKQDFEKSVSSGVLTDWELTQQFYQLSEEQKRLFIETLDWLINLTNNHMPWTGQYYAWEDWLTILESVGFRLQNQINFGLRVNGKLKQGVQMFSIFLKKTLS